MARQQHREFAVAVRHHLDQALQASKRVMVQVMRFIDHQHDRLLAFAHQVPQFPLAQFALLGDFRLLVGGKVAEQRRDQCPQRHTALLYKDRLRHDDTVLACQQFL
jgi:hypothetical protein